jgi:hypothetical protein
MQSMWLHVLLALPTQVLLKAHTGVQAIDTMRAMPLRYNHHEYMKFLLCTASQTAKVALCLGWYLPDPISLLIGIIFLEFKGHSQGLSQDCPNHLACSRHYHALKLVCRTFEHRTSDFIR